MKITRRQLRKIILREMKLHEQDTEFASQAQQSSAGKRFKDADALKAIEIFGEMYSAHPDLNSGAGGRELSVLMDTRIDHPDFAKRVHALAKGVHSHQKPKSRADDRILGSAFGAGVLEDLSRRFDAAKDRFSRGGEIAVRLSDLFERIGDNPQASLVDATKIMQMSMP